MTPNINIIDLAEKHGQTSYRNRADTKHPAYGFTEEGLQAFAHALLAAAPQAVQASEEMRVCNSEECGWIGPLSETYGYKHSPATLCPECKETTELSAAAHPPEEVPAQDMVSVKKEDANAFCRILTALGMEEEGDPVAEVQRLLAATQPAAQGLDAQDASVLQHLLSNAKLKEWDGGYRADFDISIDADSNGVRAKTAKEAVLNALAAQAKQGGA